MSEEETVSGNAELLTTKLLLPLFVAFERTTTDTSGGDWNVVCRQQQQQMEMEMQIGDRKETHREVP